MQNQEKRRLPDERELHKKIRVFAKLQTKNDFQELSAGLLQEARLKQRILQLNEYRKMGVTTQKEAIEYDKEKHARVRISIDSF